MPPAPLLVLLLNFLPLAGYLWGRFELRGWPEMVRRYRRTAGLAVLLHGVQFAASSLLAWHWTRGGGTGPGGGAWLAPLRNGACCLTLLAPVLGVACALAPFFLHLHGPRGRCPRCGYRLEPAHPAVCPECGLARPGGIEREGARRG